MLDQFLAQRIGSQFGKAAAKTVPLQCFESFVVPEKSSDSFRRLADSSSIPDISKNDNVAQPLSFYDSNFLIDVCNNCREVLGGGNDSDEVKLLEVAGQLAVKSLEGIAATFDLVAVQCAIDNSDVGSGFVAIESKLFNEQGRHFEETLNEEWPQSTPYVDISHGISGPVLGKCDLFSSTERQSSDFQFLPSQSIQISTACNVAANRVCVSPRFAYHREHD